MVKSPCIAVCSLDENKEYCMGCYRTVDEITGWRSMTEEQKQKTLNDLPRRRREY